MQNRFKNLPNHSAACATLEKLSKTTHPGFRVFLGSVLGFGSL